MKRLRESLEEIKAARRASAKERGRARRGRAPLLHTEKLSRPSRRKRRGDDDPASSPRRIAIVAAVMFLAGVAILVRAGELQLLDGERYEGAVERQASMSASIDAKRGAIRDRHGAELALTVDVDSVFAEPRRMTAEQRALAAPQLAKLLRLPVSEVRKKLEPERSFAYLARRVDPEIAKAIREAKLHAVGIMPEPKRFYSNRDLAAHVLGFSSWDGDGGAGIEKQLDSELRGKSYEVPGLRDARGKSVFTQGFMPHAVMEGADATLTIDRQIQYVAEQALRETAEKYRARGAVAIVLEVKSGEVLALASYPTYNPNNMKGTTPDDQLNRAVAAVFEPGSTLKMVTIAGALESGTIRPDEQVDCEGGRLKIGRRTIGDSHKGYEKLTIAEVMKVSSNVCAAKIGMELGSERLHHWLTAFGFGRKTGIELPGELRGLVRPAERWREIELANIAFGQGISATQLQIATAAATIANGGKRIAPRIIRELVDKSGRRKVTEAPEPEVVLSEKTARIVAEMMEEVTKKGGTAEVAAIPGFRVAGKTGTAQKIDPVTKAYSHELYVSSFVGFVPAERADVAILVMVDEPKGASYGGVVAAPAWRKIAVAALAAREVFPEDEAAREVFLAGYRPPPPAPEGAPDPTAAGPENANENGALPQGAASAEGAGPASGRGVVLDPMLSAEARLVLGLEPAGLPPAVAAVGGEEEEVSGARRMPNFAGLELREVLDRSADVHCDPVLEGSGRVVAQSPAAGEPLAAGARCELRLSPNG